MYSIIVYFERIKHGNKIAFRNVGSHEVQQMTQNNYISVHYRSDFYLSIPSLFFVAKLNYFLCDIIFNTNRFIINNNLRNQINKSLLNIYKLNNCYDAKAFHNYPESMKFSQI